MPRPKRPKITKVLVGLALAGNRAAWVELVDLVQSCIHWRISRTLLLARRTCRQDILDVQQATLMALLVENDGKLAKAWNTSRGSFETYARLIAKQEALAFLKRFENETPEDVNVPELKVSPDRSPEERFAAQELMQKAVERLKADQKSAQSQQLVELLIIEERTTAEVCAIMRTMKPNAIDQRRKRLQDRLEEILSDLGGGE